MRGARVLGASVGGALLAVAFAFGVSLASAQVIGPPEITNVSASGVSEHHATVSATIAANGHPTTYQVWVSYAPCQGGAGECPTPVQKEQIARGKLSAKMGTRDARSKVQMLTPSCTYAYWFVATNSSGTVESEHESFTATGGDSGPKACKR